MKTIMQLVLGSRVVGAKMDALGPEDIAGFAARYARRSAWARRVVILLGIVGFALGLAHSGTGWGWVAGGGFVVIAGWQRVAGCRALSGEGKRALEEMLLRAQSEGVVGQISKPQMQALVGGREDTFLLCHYLMDGKWVASRRARAMAHDTTPANAPVRGPTRL